MLKNFIKTALRSLAKNKIISFINIFGLSLAIGCSIVVYIMISFEYGRDEFHVNRENIHMLKNTVSRDGIEQIWGDSPAPIGEMMAVDFPQIKRVVRIDDRGVIMKYGDKVFNENVRFVDPKFLQMFTFPLTHGQLDALNDPSKIVISKKLAEKYFGENDPLGEQIQIVANGKKESFVIGGVADTFPSKASFSFDILANYEKKFDLYDEADPNDWTDFISSTFIQLNDPKDIGVISDNMGKYIELQNAADEDWPAKAYTFESLTTLSQNAHAIDGAIAGGSDPVGNLVLMTIAGFMLTLASFNYINISISSATRRLKEIGVRKVIGGTKKQLVIQFIGENMIICFIALILGGVWARTIFGPWFDSQFSIGLNLDFWVNADAWMFLIGLLLLIGVGSGAYPAFYIASFKPVNILRGNQKFGKKNKFTKAFLTFQFVLSIITIVFGIAFMQNAEYQKQRDWGYNQSQTLVIPAKDEASYTAMYNDFAQSSNVISIAGSSGHVGRSASLSVVDVLDKKVETRRIDVGYNYLETIDVRLKQGRFFDEALLTDKDQNVVINETFVKNMEWVEPLGMTFGLDSLTYHVIGVVEDFHYRNFNNKIQPTYFSMATDDNLRYIAMKIKEGKASELEAKAEELWKQYIPDHPYDAFFQNEVFDRYFNQLKSHGKIMGFTALFAIILSCMGLFGLVSLNVMARMKEFSIRKVLGAGVASIFHGVNTQYLWLISIACILGLPISYIMVSALLDNVYEYHMPLTAIPFIMATASLFIVALLTVSSQIYKVVSSNPVDALRNE
jgi:ABC-type antimicrobial peptide transport system permease subunit